MASAYLQTRDLSQGASYFDQINITDNEGDPIDLSGEGEWTARFQIRAGTADSGAPALVSLTNEDGIVLEDGYLTIALAAIQTEEIVASTGASVLWAELDLIEVSSDETDTYRWKLNVSREYAREEE